MLAIIGFGNHVQKNILPSLERLGYEAKYIVVRDVKKEKKSVYINKITSDLQSVLSDKSVSNVYIATPISTHFDLCKLALEANKNVICEKPIVADNKSLEILNEIACNNGVTINQVVMYKYHKLFGFIERMIKEEKYGRLISFITKFQIPHLNSSDIRYNPHLGGGALLDVGFYPISLITTLFGGMHLLEASKEYKLGYSVDLEGRAIFEKDTLIGECHWAIGQEYQNYLELKFEGATAIISRFYSKPHNLEVSINIRNKNGTCETINIGADDQFSNMFSNFFDKKNQRKSNISEAINIIADINKI